MRRWAFRASLVATLLALSACAMPYSVSQRTPPPQASQSVDIPALLAREAASPDPNFDFGQTIQITAGGVHPAILISLCCQAITWKNLTSGPITVVLDRLLVQSGPIPPGGTFSWKPPNMQSVTYHTDGGPALSGQIQVNQTFES